MTVPGPYLSIDLEQPASLVSWCCKTSLLAVGCNPTSAGGSASVRIIPLHNPSVCSTLYVPLTGPEDALVAVTFSSAATTAGPGRLRLLLTATRSGSICCWSQQPAPTDTSHTTTWDRWRCQQVATPGSSSSSSTGGDATTSSSSSSNGGQVAAVAWLHCRSPWSWNASAGNHALQAAATGSSNSGQAAPVARLDAAFHQAPPGATTAGAAAFSWLSRAAQAFAVLYRSGAVQLYWSALGRDNQPQWSSTAVLQLPSPSAAAADHGGAVSTAAGGPGLQQLRQTAVGVGHANDVWVAHTASTSTSNTTADTVHISQVTGDPVYAAASTAPTPAGAAEAAPPQPRLPVTLVTSHTCPGDMRVTALAWSPAGGQQRLAVLLEPAAVPAASSENGGAFDAALGPTSITSTAPGVCLQMIDVLGGQAVVVGSVSLRSPQPPHSTSSSSSSGSNSSSRCVWSHDASWLAIVTRSGACILLDAQQLLPLKGAWATPLCPLQPTTGAAAAAATAHRVWHAPAAVAVAPSPNSCAAAVLCCGCGVGPGGLGPPGCQLRLWEVQGSTLGGPGSTAASSSSGTGTVEALGGVSDPQAKAAAAVGGGTGAAAVAERRCAAAVGRTLWSLTNGTHCWDVVQLLLALPQPPAAADGGAAAGNPAPAVPDAAATQPLQRPSIATALAAVDWAVMRHPHSSRANYSSRWDVLKLAVVVKCPGEAAGQLAMELRVRLHVGRVLSAAMLLAEGVMIHLRGHQKLDPSRLAREDVLALHRWNLWGGRLAQLLLQALKTWGVARQLRADAQGQPQAAAEGGGAAAEPAEAAGGRGAANGSSAARPAVAASSTLLVRLLLDADVRSALLKVYAVSLKVTASAQHLLGGAKALHQGTDAVWAMWSGLLKDAGAAEDPTAHWGAVTAMFPSPYQLHYHRLLSPATALLGRLEVLQGAIPWQTLAVLLPGDVGEALVKLGLGWEVPPEVTAQYDEELQLHSTFRRDTPSSSSANSSKSMGGTKRSAPAAAAGVEGGGGTGREGPAPAAAVAAQQAAKRARWQAAAQMALGHPQAYLSARITPATSAIRMDPLTAKQLARSLGHAAAQPPVAAGGAAAAPAAAHTENAQLLLAQDGSCLTTAGLAGNGAIDDKGGVAVVGPQSVAWAAASPITGELWDKRQL